MLVPCAEEDHSVRVLTRSVGVRMVTPYLTLHPYPPQGVYLDPSTVQYLSTMDKLVIMTSVYVRLIYIVLRGSVSVGIRQGRQHLENWQHCRIIYTFVALKITN